MEESVPADTPMLPFEDICVDFFLQDGASFIAYCDRFSGFLTVAKARFLRGQCERFGVPTTQNPTPGQR